MKWSYLVRVFAAIIIFETTRFYKAKPSCKDGVECFTGENTGWNAGPKVYN